MSFKLTKPGGGTKISPSSSSSPDNNILSSLDSSGGSGGSRSHHLSSGSSGGSGSSTATVTSSNPHHRRSLRERLRDGIQSTTAGIPLPSFQTKSHSMDSKSVPKEAATAAATATGTNNSNSNKSAAEPVVSGDQCITVSDKDTLTSLAAKYNSTPNELIRLNRLNSRFIFPGQKLKVPEKNESQGSGSSSHQHQHQQHHLQRSNSSSVFGDESDSLDGSSLPPDVEMRQKKFIKLKVKHITDGNGVVSGTLLITPNAIMHDPNVSDPLVLDQGAEIYGIILPIELIVAAGIFNDISNMRVKQSFIEPLQSTNVILYKPELTTTIPCGSSMTRSMTEGSSSKKMMPEPPQLTSHSMTSSQLQLSLSPLPLGKEEKSNILKRFSFPLTSTFSSVSEDLATATTKEVTKAGTATTTAISPRGGTTSLSLDAEGEADLLPQPEQKTDTEDDGNENENEKYSEIEQWYLCLTTGYPATTSAANSSTTAQAQPHAAARTQITPISYGQKKYLKPEYWFSISSEDVNELYCFWNIWWPHLYGLVDPDIIHSRGYELIDWSTDLSTVLNLGPERPSQRRSMTSSSAADDFEAKVAAQAAQINELTKESWEMIKAPYGKLYSFLQRGQTILTSTTSCDSNYGSTSSGGGSGGGGGGGALGGFFNTEAEFEIVSMSELDGRSSEYSYSETLPEIIGGPSLIFKTDKHILSISKNLTARAEGYPWVLVFSTEAHGFSLGTLYRKMESVDEWSPILLVIEDTQERIFGALVSAPLKLSEHFYGTGQSFLFNFTSTYVPASNNEDEDPIISAPPEPTLNIWKWTGENLFFIKGNPESISVGAGDGKFGIWLDSDLFVGRSDSCWTYGNPPLVPEKDFIVKTLEAWAFGAPSGGYSSVVTTTATTPSQAPILSSGIAAAISNNTSSHTDASAS